MPVNTVTGTENNDSLVGTIDDDIINGLAGDDTLLGNGGNDTLEGGAGNDALDGGDGSDTASYESATGSVFAQIGFGTDEYDPGFSTYLSHDTFVSIENITGSDYDDELYGDDNANVLDGRGGNDFIQGRGGDDTIYGGDGNDTLQGDRGDLFTGPSGNDIVYGEGGNDVLRGGLGDDQLYGGDGNDLMRGGGGVDSFDGGADDGEGFNGIGDRVSFYEQRATQGAVADLRTGIISNDGYGNAETMVGIESLGGGTAYADTFYGNDGRNFLFGDLGDSVYGFGGDDLFQLSSAAATLDGGSGSDTLLLNTGGGALTPDTNADGVAEVMAAATAGWTVNLLGGTMFDGYGNFGTITGIENVTGSELADTIRGDNNNNVLLGAGGDDFVIGNGGDDIVDGGDGSDILRGDAQTYTGGAFGNDILIGGAGDDLMRGSAGVDSYDGGSDSGGLSIYGGFGDRISFYEVAATAGVVADLRTGVISNDGFGNVETMTGVESLGGDTAFVDTFYGNDSRNTLLGGRGDNLYAYGGDDQISLGVAAAVADGGDGIDVLQLNSAGGWLMPDANSDGLAETAVAAGAGWSIDLAGGTMVDGYGNAGVVTDIENVDGSELGDTLVGDDNDNVLNGLDGDDTLDGRGGSDTLDGGNGIDTVSYANATGAVDLDLGAGLADEYDSDGITYLSTDTLANIENATGSAFADALVGSGSNNVLQGLAGNDFLDGRGGDDQIDGGAGVDTANYAGAGSAVTVDLASGTASGGGGNDTLTGIEAVTGSNFDDLLIGDSGANSLTGRNGNDTLLAGGGDDFMRGGAGDDVMDGGTGFDRVSHYGTNITNGVTVDLRIAGAQNTGHGWDTYTGIESLSGSRYSDTLIGDDNDNWLIAADGNDTLIGNGGNDLLTVADGEIGPASGNHSIDGGSGVDTVDVSWSTLGGDGVTLSLALQGAAQDSGHGMLTLTNIENLSGGAYADALTGDGNANTLSGHAGDDTLIGGAGNDSLYGDGALVADTRASSGGSGPITFFADVTTFDPSLVAGNDLLEGGLGDDLINGGGGIDTASYANASGAVTVNLFNLGTGNGSATGADGNDTLAGIENITGSAFNDALTGNALANVIDGGDGNDALRGRGGNDRMLGGGGADFLNGGQGDDVVDGGAGSDRAAYYTDATSGVTVDLRIQGVAQNTGQGMDTLVGIEHVSGTLFGDVLTGNDGDNWIWGSPATLGDGSLSTSNNDVIDGQGGNDLIGVGIGNHSIDGGSGTDTLYFTENFGDDPAVTISLALQGGAQVTGQGSWTITNVENLSGGTGNDALTGDGNANILAGFTGNDMLVGGAGNDTLYGDGLIGVDANVITTFTDAVASFGGVSGNDTLEGGLGNDTLDGGGGIDTASYANAAGSVNVNLGTGTSSGADGNDTLTNIENITGSGFNDSLTGSGGDNVLDGLGGNDTISGGAGDDTLNGGDGNDFLQGDLGENNITVTGNDVLNGGNGNDTLRGGLGDDQMFGGANNDLFRGNGGVDYFDGGADDGLGFNGIGDRVSFFEQRATQGVVADLRTGIISNDGFGNVETMVGIESLGGDTAFIDTFYGNDGHNYLAGGRGDFVYGFGGDDLFQLFSATAVLDGGDGVDRLALAVGFAGQLLPDSNGDGLAEFAAAATAGFTVNLTAGTILDGYGFSGTVSGIENVDGTILADTLIGDANANVFNGFDGNDVLDGRGGNDTLNGGNGIDTASYANASGAVTANLFVGTASGADGNDTLVDIENLLGSNFNDTLVGNEVANLLSGGDGDDLLRGNGGNDLLYGGNGNDIIKGQSGDDLIDGGAGIDRAGYYQADAALGGVTVSLLLQGAAQYVGSEGWDTLVSIENVFGTPFADSLTGDDGANWLSGSEATISIGNVSTTNTDTLDGQGGNDLLSIGIGNHTVNGGSGIDTLWFTEHGFPETGIVVSLALQGAAQTTGNGDWTLIGIENLSGGVANDTLTGDGNDNVLGGNSGNDTLIGGAGNDVLYGDGAIGVDGNGVITTYADVATISLSGIGADVAVLPGAAGNDLLEGGLGNDTLNGGGGTDTASYANASGGVTVTLTASGGSSSGADGNDTLLNIENILGGAFNDILTGNGGANLIDGGGGHDKLSGGAGDDTLLGGTGDDTLTGGAGDDVYNGGGGFDRASFFGASAGVTVNLTSAGAQNTGQGMDTLIGIENLTGTQFADTLIGDAGDNWLWGFATSTVPGTTGNNDTLNGGGGNDLLWAGNGNQTLIGGTGNDTVMYNENFSSDVSVTISLLNPGVAQNTGQGMWTLTGIENLVGGTANDVLTGDGANNILCGGAGTDTLNGGIGNDTLYGDGEITFDDHGTGGSGPIIIVGDAVAVYGGVAGNDKLNGGDGDDFLYGGGGNDVMKGDKGNDTLYGGSGNDSLVGGAGNDRYVIEANSGADTITGFTHVDRIVFDTSSGITSFGQLTLTATGGTNTLVTWGNGNSILIEGLRPRDMTAADFQFTPSAGFEHVSHDFASSYAVPHDIFI